MKQNIRYDCRWSNECDDKFILDFRFVCSEVFHQQFSEEQFERKFIKNIYGPSVLVVVYIDDKPSAARALWRNDISDKEAFQPGNTCVMEVCRGKGIFIEMTRQAMAMLKLGVIVYNFPNPNSYPGYIKMGWKLLHDYNDKLLTNYSEFVKEHPVMMDNDYFDWYVKGANLTYAKRFGHYFLLHKDRRPFCYRVLAEVEESRAKTFPHAHLGLLFYKTEKSTWYNRHFTLSHVVTRNPNLSYIPTWKIDAL